MLILADSSLRIGTVTKKERRRKKEWLWSFVLGNILLLITSHNEAHSETYCKRIFWGHVLSLPDALNTFHKIFFFSAAVCETALRVACGGIGFLRTKTRSRGQEKMPGISTQMNCLLWQHSIRGSWHSKLWWSFTNWCWLIISQKVSYLWQWRRVFETRPLFNISGSTSTWAHQYPMLRSKKNLMLAQPCRAILAYILVNEKPSGKLRKLALGTLYRLVI